jgi:hypothetical protein
LLGGSPEEEGYFMEQYELGIFFNLKEMSRRDYAAEAWEIFMKHCNPRLLKNSDLFHGEMGGHLAGQPKMFCITVRTPEIQTVQYLKEVFTSCQDKRLAPPLDRARESNIVVKHQLPYRGRVDSGGRLETGTWSRVDHELCKMAGWPYFPKARPPWLTETQHRELDAMNEPSFKSPDQEKIREKKKHVDRRYAVRKAVLFLKRIAGIAALILVVAGAAFGWFNREEYTAFFRRKVEENRVRRTLGREVHAKYLEGFALVNLSRMPPELPLKEMNRRFEQKGYYILKCSDEALTDASMECSTWFAENHSGVDHTTQGFISIYIRDKSGAPLWTELANSVIVLRQPAKDQQAVRNDSILAAISSLGFADLPDGRSLKHYQREKGNPYRTPLLHPAVAVRQEVMEKKLQSQILEYVSERWVMSQRMHLASGSKQDVIVLEQTDNKICARTRTGQMVIPASAVTKVESFDEALFSEQLYRVLAPLRKTFTQEWQHKTCNDLIGELSKKFATYGPSYPDCCLSYIRTEDATGQLEALLKTSKGEITVRKGERVEGFEVVGIDSETNSVLVRMGEGGELLRIWSWEFNQTQDISANR